MCEGGGCGCDYSMSVVETGRLHSEKESFSPAAEMDKQAQFCIVHFGRAQIRPRV